MNDSTTVPTPISRRDFVKSTALAAAAIGAAGPALSVAGYFRSNDDTIKVGIIGCGGRGTGAALQAIRADKGAVLVSMSDVFQDRLDACLLNLKEGLAEQGEAEVARKLRVGPGSMHTGFDGYKRVIESDADVVLLTSYPHFRPLHYRAAIEAGKHVFAEKPLAIDGPGIRSVLESARLAKQKNLATVVGFCWRYNDGMREAFARLHGGGIGPIITAYTTYLTTTLSRRPRQPGWSDMEFQLRNWWHFNWLSGDHIVEQAIHSIDRMAWAMNDKPPARVTCLGGRAARSGPEHGDVFDHFSAVYEYDDGRRAFHSCRQIDGCPSDNTDYISGSQGRATVNGWTPTYLLEDLGGKEIWRYPGQVKTDMYQNEHNELFASLRAGSPLNDCERGARSTLMAIMARMAAYSGQVVTWDQALNSAEELKPATYDFGPMPPVQVPVPGQKKPV